ncbi:MAG: D-sedoheptulose 7-phosphate isomerase [Candidatus Omnitrophota bacterium]|nr:D-sedoheptulose 7-phosphate isomerase [Candidatus Omnitrophota bacterium]MDZ4241744.1 D-sedoheptulose 7-phosphate isomerase [Candidatus Omnitrophota bacterium]
MKQFIEEVFRASIRVKEQTLKDNVDAIASAAQAITACLKNNGRIFFFGNGGSAADSQHIAAEFIGRFQKERRSLPAIALTTDTSALTAIGNDYGFEVVFARQLEGLGHKGDVAVGISTSGNSPNVIAAIKKAKSMGMTAVVFTGEGGGKLAPLSDIKIMVPSKVTARIQESHICIAHCICELVENQFSG